MEDQLTLTEPTLKPITRTGRDRMLKALRGLPVDRPPIWLMRQAGRCLPEYRSLKERHDFQELIQTPELAAEVTLQPIRRFGFDAAILFSDILVVPEAMGQGFGFQDKGGVKMTAKLQNLADIKNLSTEGVRDQLSYVADALKMIVEDLDERTALLGFAGSPWTLANFMLEGGSSKKFTKAADLFHQDRGAFDLLAKKLTSAVIDFLQLQIDCGVDAIQIFDSLGGLLPTNEFEQASGQWIKTIVSALGGQRPVIVYSKGTRCWDGLVKTGAQVLGIDHGIDLRKVEPHLPGAIGIQGNFNPDLLVTESVGAVQREATRLLELMRDRHGYIFNLGHGVPPNAKLENLEALAATVQRFV